MTMWSAAFVIANWTSNVNNLDPSEYFGSTSLAKVNPSERWSLNRANNSQLFQGGGDARQGEQYLDSFVPTDRDYSRAERAQQQKQLHEMMQSVRSERNQRIGQ
jgi:hypothetical protein